MKQTVKEEKRRKQENVFRITKWSAVKTMAVENRFGKGDFLHSFI